MFNLTFYAVLALTAVSFVSGVVVPRRNPPPGWATDYLEAYAGYHARYLANECQNKHGESFFTECCHPLLAGMSVPQQCVPSPSASSSAAAIEPTSTVKTPITAVDDDGDNDDDDDDDCDEDDGDDSDSTSVVAPINTPAVTSTSKSAPVTTTEQPKATATATPTPEKASTSTKETSAPKPTQTPDASPAPSSSVNTGGFATFFYQNGVAGACGTVHGENDLIAAIDSERYGDLGAKSSLCGKKVKITNPTNEKTVVVTIADACPTCNGANSIDLSQGAFKQIATLDQGMVGITWSFV